MAWNATWKAWKAAWDGLWFHRHLYGLCSQSNLAQIQAEIQKTGAQLTAARLSSRGISSSLSIDQAETYLVPARAVSNQRGQMVLAGALVGFLLGLWVIQVDFSGWTTRMAARE